MKTILIVDDYRANTLMVEQILNDEYNVISTSSGSKALQLIPTCQPDLVLLDIMMPEMDGIETLKKIREKRSFQDLPVMFLTGQADKKNVMEGFKLGIVDVIAKPIDGQHLKERIRRVFNPGSAS